VQLFLIEDSRTCRNFRVEKKILRPKVKQPENDEIRFIPLTQRKFAIVDAADYERLKKYKWYASKRKYTSYAYRWENQKPIAMHREVINVPDGMLVDHIDHNGLNNRMTNLRPCKAFQNAANTPAKGGTSKYKGVHWSKSNKKWMARITFRRKEHNLGSFDSEIDAAKAYDKKAAELLGEFAYLNFPDRI